MLRSLSAIFFTSLHLPDVKCLFLLWFTANFSPQKGHLCDWSFLLARTDFLSLSNSSRDVSEFILHFHNISDSDTAL